MTHEVAVAVANARRGRAFRAWVLAATTLAHALTIHSASAQTPSTNHVLAEALFREGRELMERDKVAEACAKFAESYRLDRALGTLLNLAVCHEKEGKVATAWSEFSEAAAEGATNKDDRAAFAQKHAATLEPDLPRVQLVIAPPTRDIASTEIQLDKTSLGRSAWTSNIPVDPGPHEVVAWAQGKKPYRTTFNVPSGAGVTTVSIPALEEPPRAPVDAAPATPGSTSTGGTQRAVGYLVGAVGIVGLGLGGAFGLSAISLKHDRDSECDPTHRCSRAGVEHDSSARDAATISTIGFIAGGGLLLGGVVLVLTAPSANSVRVGTSGRSVVVGGTF